MAAWGDRWLSHRYQTRYKVENATSTYALLKLPVSPAFRVSCWMRNTVVRTFLTTKSFAAGSSMDPCHLACILKSVPRDVIPLIGCSTQLPRSAVAVTRVSRGWLLNIPFLHSSWSSGFLRRFAHDDKSERSLLAETHEGTLCGTPQVSDK